ncbi:MAG TPA: solute carrier family 23 protein [Oscillospiraceae bacterium]|nr:solute carrier family 23 protein [Oscillospiraceae bacterium]
MMDNQTGMIYKVDEKMETKQLILYGIQWALFMVYGIVWAYSIIGVGAGLDSFELSKFITNVVFTMGVSTLIQASVGHRLGAMSAPSAVTLIATLSIVSLSGIEYGFQAYNAFIIAGIVVAILGATGVIGHIRKVWTPLVLGSMIMTLGLSVMVLAADSLTANGLGITFAIGIILALLCGYLSVKGKGIWATLPAMVVLIIGYLFFIVVGKFDWSISNAMPFFNYPRIFPYGFSFPPIELIIIMTVVALFNAMLCYGNVQGVASAVGAKVDEKQTRKTFVIHGLVETSIAGIFGVPALVPYSENIGYNVLTKVASRYPIYVASVLFIIVSFLGKVVGFMAAIPIVLAGSILLGFAAPLVAVGASVWSGIDRFGTREQFICGFSIFLAMGLSLLDPATWSGMPQLISTLLTTPVVTVMIFVIILEQIVFRESN